MAFASICSVAAGLGVACQEPRTPIPEPPEIEVDPPEVESETVRHALAPVVLQAGEERLDCYSWTPDNEQAHYVSAVDFTNRGSFHHSNWYAVPDTVYEGPDGFWTCDDRAFDELAAAQSGTVLFAQSTQAWHERVEFTEGVVVRIPPHSRIVGQVHLLNLAPDERETTAWMDLDVLHPFYVETVLSPIQLTYLDLQIPASTEIRFAMDCALEQNVTLHYVLPHYHGTGNYFELRTAPLLSGVPPVFTHEGFGAQPLGHVLDPPVVADGGLVGITCGFDNPYDQPLKWGIGLDEMCVALALADAPVVYAGVVNQSEWIRGTPDTVPIHGGRCNLLGFPKGLAYAMPTVDEAQAPLYVPPGSDPDEIPPPPACSDADPSVSAAVAPTFENLQAHVLQPWCSFSACHGDAGMAGLRFEGDDVRTALLQHEVRGSTELPLVAPGDAEGSWLYRLVSRCDPGAGAHPMPYNAPVLLEDDIVAIVRAWIDAGAPQ